MRATPIPDHEIWEGAVRKVIGPPRGDLDSGIAPVEALIDEAPAGGLTFSMRCELEDDDLAKLQAGGTIWLTFWGHVVPFAHTVLEAQHLVHGISRLTGRHVCGDPDGIGTDTLTPAMPITCPACRKVLS